MKDLNLTQAEEKLLERIHDHEMVDRMRHAAYALAAGFSLMIASIAYATRNYIYVAIVSFVYITIAMVDKMAWLQALENFRTLSEKLLLNQQEKDK